MPVEATPTRLQATGIFGEQRVARNCSCPRCKRHHTLVRLPPKFKCADLICDFCGYLAQVKTATVADIGTVPRIVFGAAWKPQKDRMTAGVYFPLFLVLVARTNRRYSIFYLPADLQTREMFMARPPLGKKARRAGWQGFMYDLGSVRDRFVKLG